METVLHRTSELLTELFTLTSSDTSQQEANILMTPLYSRKNIAWYGTISCTTSQ